MCRIALASSVMSSLQQVWKDRYLSLPTTIRVYKILVLPILLYACETWTVLAADERSLEAFHINCQCQITKIRWQDHIRNSEVAACTSLGPVSDLITCRRNAVFGHIASLPEDTPAHQALRCHVDLTLNHLPDQSWSVAHVIPTTDGLTSYAGTTTTRHQLTCGEDPPHVVIREWCYGPRRLRIDDDDWNCILHHWGDHSKYLFNHKSGSIHARPKEITKGKKQFQTPEIRPTLLNT